MRKSTRILTTVVTAATAVVAGTAAAAYSATRADRFGHTSVRAGVPKHVAEFAVTSPELAGGGFPAADYANAFGCTGADHTPSFQWSGAPAGTKSFAITMFDRDAPTGSGFWHWVNWDVPASATSFAGTLPAGAVAGTNDTGATGYLGPCPSVGDVPHRYEIRVLALDVPALGLAAGTPAALTAFTLGGHVIGEAELTATAQR
jgi:Raf kinase inhibitor-like YbhB/YbcL family protein